MNWETEGWRGRRRRRGWGVWGVKLERLARH